MKMIKHKYLIGIIGWLLFIKLVKSAGKTEKEVPKKQETTKTEK